MPSRPLLAATRTREREPRGFDLFTREELRLAILDDVEAFYDRNRMHSSQAKRMTKAKCS